MKIVVLRASALWMLLIFPALCVLRRRWVRQPTIVFPNAAIVKKIIGKAAAKRGANWPAICENLSIFTLIVAYSEPMFAVETAVVACKTSLVLASLCCFFAEVFLKSTFFHRIS
ncbi:MAG: hypothetical protein LBI61_04105 [Puniceicoccales bacterium]|jgi:hypothetical protein|nr:hypothetical protein [Puniceicoccales bacterium]